MATLTLSQSDSVQHAIRYICIQQALCLEAIETINGFENTSLSEDLLKDCLQTCVGLFDEALAGYTAYKTTVYPISTGWDGYRFFVSALIFAVDCACYECDLFDEELSGKLRIAYGVLLSAKKIAEKTPYTLLEISRYEA